MRVAKLDLVFPEFSSSKTAQIKPDVVLVPEDAPALTFDLIIGVNL